MIKGPAARTAIRSHASMNQQGTAGLAVLIALLVGTAGRHIYAVTAVIDDCGVSLLDADGAARLLQHAETGLTMSPHGQDGPERCVSLGPIEHQDGVARASVQFADGRTADLLVRSAAHWHRIAIIPQDTGRYDISLRFGGGLNPAYGMGDHGGYGPSFNIYPFRREIIHQHQGGQELRFLSTFTVFPRHRLAIVLFSPDRKSAVIDDEVTSFGVVNSPKLDGLYVFHGSMEQIYSAYREVRKAEGLFDARPDANFFRLGFESYGALHWNTSQARIEEAVEGLLERGYPLRWVVCGSGFWKNPRSKPIGPEGATTSFGLWGQRYPDPDSFKRFCRDRNLQLILGLRHGFPALGEHGGNYDEAIHGSFSRRGLQAGYFLSHEDGSPRTFRVHFPRAVPVYLLNPHHPNAVDWFVRNAELWGADGFKEDFMFVAERNDYFDDYKHNPMLERLSASGHLVMVRNAAYSVPGSILRINDTDIKHKPADQDRIPINCLAYAASGQPNVYPDIIGGRPIANWTQRERRYLTRMAMLSAVLPALSIGNLPWMMNDPDCEAAVLKAIRWHDRYVPYIYSAAIESFNSGYPRTVTPLPIAFPDDSGTYDLASHQGKVYSWMLGPSLLACPVFGSDYDRANSRDVYLPVGRWMDYETGELFEGPRKLENHPCPIDKMPLFVGGTGMLIAEEGDHLVAEIFPNVMDGSSFEFVDPGSGRTSRLMVDLTGSGGGQVTVRTLPRRSKVRIDQRPPAGWRFTLEPGTHYLIKVAK